MTASGVIARILVAEMRMSRAPQCKNWRAGMREKANDLKDIAEKISNIKAGKRADAAGHIIRDIAERHLEYADRQPKNWREVADGFASELSETLPVVRLINPRIRIGELP